MIRDQLLAALDAALDAAGFPAPSGGIELTPPKDTGHGDFTTNLALQLAKPLGHAARATSPPGSSSSSSGRARRTSNGSRSPVPASSTSTSRPSWLHEVLLAVVATR